MSGVQEIHPSEVDLSAFRFRLALALLFLLASPGCNLSMVLGERCSGQ